MDEDKGGGGGGGDKDADGETENPAAVNQCGKKCSRAGVGDSGRGLRKVQEHMFQFVNKTVNCTERRPNSCGFFSLSLFLKFRKFLGSQCAAAILKMPQRLLNVRGAIWSCSGTASLGVNQLFTDHVLLCFHTIFSSFFGKKAAIISHSLQLPLYLSECIRAKRAHRLHVGAQDGILYPHLDEENIGNFVCLSSVITMTSDVSKSFPLHFLNILTNSVFPATLATCC